MKKTTAAMVLLLAGCVASAPLPWSDVPSSELGRVTELRRDDCPPRASEIGLPVFPGAEVYYVHWARKAPTCHPLATPGGHNADFFLLSRAPMEEVVRWYDARLAHLARYESRGSIYYLTRPIEGFSVSRDWKGLENQRNLEIADQGAAPVGTIGYRTLILIRDP